MSGTITNVFSTYIEERHIPGLAKQAREDLEDLGATFIKLGQMMSVRPDVLPQAALEELVSKMESAQVCN